MEYMTAMSDFLPAPANVTIAGHEVSPIAWGMWRFAGVDVATARARIDGRHPRAGDSLADIPNACLECHGRDAEEAPPFARLLHAIHLTGGAESVFMTVYQGECTHCHKLDPASGAWSLASGPER